MKASKQHYEINYAPPNPIGEFTSDGVRFRFIISVERFYPQNEFHIVERPYVRIDTDRRTDLTAFWKLIRALQAFVALATRSFSHVGDFIVRVFDENGDETVSKMLRKEIAPVREVRRLHQSDMRFTYTEIADEFPRLMSTWLKKRSALERTYTTYLGDIGPRRSYLENRFLLLTQAIEGYHRERIDDKETSLEHRLRQLVEKSPKTLADSFSDEEIRRIVRTRHYYTHRISGLEKLAVTDPGLLVQITEKLRILVECLLLTEMGFENGRINAHFLNQFEREVLAGKMRWHAALPG
jgi:hypothetical protein